MLRALGLGGIEGFVDAARAGEIRGWARDPARPGVRVRVAARCDGVVVAEGTADLPRRDLVRDGRGDGRCGFALRLPRELSESGRRVRVEAVSGWLRTRLVGGDLVLEPARQGEGVDATEPLEPQGSAVTAMLAHRPRVALLLWPGESGLGRTLASWEAQDWSDLSVARMGRESGGPVGETFGPEDEAALRGFLNDADTVLLARPGDELAPQTARLLAQTRPLADVLTFESRDTSGAGRRPEARALGVLLGETLGGCFAVRSPALDLHRGPLIQTLTSDPRRFELWLAARPELRWAHLPAPLYVRYGQSSEWSAIERGAAEGLDGFDFREGDGSRASRIVPARTAGLVTLAVWPLGGAAWFASVQALVSTAGDVPIEVLAAPGDVDETSTAFPGVSVRAADQPVSNGAGPWLRALGEAANGEVVVFCRVGVIASFPVGGLDEMAGWALLPTAGAVTLQMSRAGGAPLAGLGVSARSGSWRCDSAYEAARNGQRRPVLAAPAAFLVVARSKLASAGGVDGRRFPGGGADLDLGLRLRRAGWPAILLADLRAAGPETAPEAEAPGAELAGFDSAELAGAAQAYPLPGG